MSIVTEKSIMQVQDSKVFVHGAELFSSSTAELLNDIEALCHDDQAHLVVTLNVDQTLQLRQDKLFLEAYRRASLRIIDGMPLVALARLLGLRSVHRNTGADLLRHVLDESMTRNWRVAIAGGSKSDERAILANIQESHPDADAVFIPFPRITDVHDQRSIEVIRELESVKPQVVFLCLGAPKQELWFSTWLHILPRAVYVGAGAAVDFTAGKQKRAPEWLQRAGLEWAWRLSHEPTRLWKRYLLRGPLFIVVAVQSIFVRRIHHEF
ncbi:WecB/TagA/CpsF family glycosyltransferase [Cryobacterium sp. Y50]|uniref:WecB/TagA/CpsF family glycosyltransferase n=1 Tax=Cryobacterium sp. Y50 TaxID=2048286 RepID=UPI000CE382C4|nr:WecB/TagA/CpsF family glycosyltransferase [Cryobacterium sp. Y50]